MDFSSLNKTTPKVLSKRRHKVSKFFTVDQLDLQFSNDRVFTYERIAGGRGAVLAVPFDGTHFYLTSEYACGFERYELGFVKGKIDVNEEPASACNRELEEEIGYGAGKIELLRDEITVAPGMLQLKMFTFLCTDLYAKSLTGDEPEPIEIIKVTPKEAMELIFAKDSPLSEARSIAALCLSMKRLNFLSFNAQ